MVVFSERYLCHFLSLSNIRVFLEKHFKVEEFCMKNMIVECKYISTKFQETIVTHLTGNNVLLSKPMFRHVL
jgi:hypothetical protein